MENLNPFFRLFISCSRWAVFLVGVASFAKVSLAQSVPLPSYPRAEYYLGYNGIKDGRLEQADEALRTALRPLNIETDERGIESIPGLTMRGEYYYHRGDLTSALEQYDAVLSISTRSASWLHEVRMMGTVAPRNDAYSKTVNWASSKRATKAAVIPLRWQAVPAAVGTTIQSPDGDGIRPGTVLTIDAAEVVRCQAIAARRRIQILGPLVDESKLTQDFRQSLVENFRLLPSPLMEMVRTSEAISSMSQEPANQVADRIVKHLSMVDQTDHSLTPLAMIVMADLAIKEGKVEEAMSWLVEATLSGAAFEQLDIVAEAIQMMGAIAAHHREVRIHEMLDKIFQWSRNRSLLIMASCSLSSAESLVCQEDEGRAWPFLRQWSNLITQNDLDFPALQARGHWAMAKLYGQQGKLDQSRESLEKSLGLLQGQDSAFSPSRHLYRLRLVEQLQRDEIWNASVTSKYLTMMVSHPGPLDWAYDPIDSMVAAMSDKSNALQWMLNQAILKQDANAVANLVDLAQRQQFLRLNPLGGRMLALRRALLAPPWSQSPAEVSAGIRWSQQLPALANTSRKYLQLADEISMLPIQIDPKTWNEATLQRWHGFETATQDLERLIGIAALSSESIDLTFPAPLALLELPDRLPDGDAILCFFPSGGSYFGLILDSQGAETWVIDQLPVVETQIGQVLLQLGVSNARQDVGKLNSLLSGKSIDETTRSWIPKQIGERLKGLTHLCIVPVGVMWYFPFEILPSPGDSGRSRWIESYSLHYSPTLGQAARSYDQSPSIRRTVALTRPGFYSSNANAEKSMMAPFFASGNDVIELQVGNTASRWQASRWARLQVGRALISGYLPLTEANQFAPFGYDGHLEDGHLSRWMDSPLRSPSELILPGVETSVASGRLGNGNELFSIACALQASGTRSLLISRWPVGGASSWQLMETYLDGLPRETASRSWQRSVLSFWEEVVNTESEPILASDPKRPATTTGKLPILWSGYMQIGDTHLAP